MIRRLVGSRKRSDVGTHPAAGWSACACRRRLLPGRGAGPWLARSGSPATAAAASSAYLAPRTIPVLRSSSASSRLPSAYCSRSRPSSLSLSASPAGARGTPVGCWPEAESPVTRSLAARSGPGRAHDDSGAVRDDLSELLADLGRVESHRDHGIPAQQLGVLDHPVDRMPAAVFEQLGVLADLALPHRAEARAERLGDTHAADYQAEGKAEIGVDDHAGELEAGSYGKLAWRGVTHGSNLNEAALVVARLRGWL